MKPTDSAYDDDSRAEHAQLVDDLKLQVQKAEIASEHYQKELEILQMRLNEVVIERNNLENQISEKDGEVEAVHAEFKDVMRRNKELEQAHYAEKAMLFKEQERQLHKEQELNGVIQRLNETIRQKEVRAQVDGDGAVVPRSGMYSCSNTYNDQLMAFQQVSAVVHPQIWIRVNLPPPLSLREARHATTPRSCCKKTK